MTIPRQKGRMPSKLNEVEPECCDYERDYIGFFGHSFVLFACLAFLVVVFYLPKGLRP
jgi:hypothetical protein